MLRYRRYRVFLLLAIFLIVALYRFTTVQEWEHATATSVEKLKSYAGQSYKGHVEQPKILQPDSKPDKPKEIPEPIATDLHDEVKAAIPQVTAKPIGDWELGSKPTPTPKAVLKSSPAGLPATTSTGIPGKKFGLGGQGRLDAPEPLKDSPAIHWSRMPQHFPVPTESIIALPTGKPKAIAKIQTTFKEETSVQKADREKKQSAIKKAFVHSWKGYRDHAWGYDELKPISGANRNTFCGWGATMVDALDTLWIMGLEDEFADAVKALEDIDFTTTPRSDIPLFETTIRYLGGLLAAYDISEARYKIILTKAQELGDILLSAFDTPNRMPITYYNWRPTFAKNPHRAGTRTVLAELGSLTMEFTRLAQLTKEDKYYDAVARITNELDLMQDKTRVPGLWPEHIDTSGCQKPPSPSPQEAIQQQAIAEKARSQNAAIGGESFDAKLDQAKAEDSASAAAADGARLKRRQLYSDDAESPDASKAIVAGAPAVLDEDKPKAPTDQLVAKSKSTTTSGKAKTPKSKKPLVAGVPAVESEIEGGKAAADALAKKTARVKSGGIKKGDEIEKTPDPLVAENAQVIPPGQKLGEINTNPPQVISRDKVDCLPQGLASPPGSFSETFKFGGAADSTYEYLPKMYLLLGGLAPQYDKMYKKAIDAANKHLLFRQMIPDNDRELLVVGGARVEDGYPEYPGNLTRDAEQSHLLCFAGGMWGIGSKIFNREDDFDIAKKITDGCVWAYESFQSGIMPESMEVMHCESRSDCAWNETQWKETLDPYWRQRDEQRLQAQAELKEYETQLTAEGKDPDSANEGSFRVMQPGAVMGADGPEQGQGDGLARRQVIEAAEYTETAEKVAEKVAAAVEEVPTYNPYPTHDEAVAERIKQGRLPKGVPSIPRKNYILRPEAIESVFIMYRMTGDNYWREKGWKMWLAIDSQTKAAFGHSAIRDVTKKDYVHNQNDEMESFWLAETLKYFYLLFSPPDVVSLDEWVLNTEAHPFKRPT